MKAVAILLVLLLASVFAAPVTCAGWEVSAAQRRACCQRAHHQHFADQAIADTCCAAHEQACRTLATPVSQGVAAGTAVMGLPVPGFDAAALSRSLTARDTAGAARRLHDPPGLLAPPLRI